ncbi:MAG: DUF1343 domain-containing protein, partial [Ignavibacteria bacterium]|nr:DUF1343 domain-containing protein [Ignavibacteria bacterium]
SGEHIVDFLHKTKKVTIKAIFGPEHGFRGDIPDGRSIENFQDEKTGIQVYSLYGKVRKPTPEMLDGIEVLIFDIQDVGARFYTYISTLSNCLEAAAENKIKFIVCDRPNPIGGLEVDGPILKSHLKSFVGIQPIPIQHGMTIGELAKMFNEELWLENKVKADLEIITVKNLTRNMLFDETGLKWIKPSPNMVNLDAAILYPGLCLIEGTNISEGRGTQNPFLWIGAPYIESEKLISELNKYHLPGITFNPIEFTPQSIPNMSTSPKYKDTKCYGIEIRITDREKVEAVKLGLTLIYTIRNLFKEKFEFRLKSFNNLVGDEKITEMISNDIPLQTILTSWQQELESFKKIREKYLLYN